MHDTNERAFSALAFAALLVAWTAGYIVLVPPTVTMHHTTIAQVRP